MTLRLWHLACVLGLSGCLAAADPWTVHPIGSTDAPYGFLEHLPPGYTPTTKAKIKLPLLIALHGVGELGDSDKELAKAAKAGPLRLLADNDPLGKLIDAQNMIVVAPQGLKSDKWWRTDKLIATLDVTLKRHPLVDLDRIYVTGLSMGGGGTWALATGYPDRFAAAVPICGAAKPGNVERLGNLPIWAHHAIGDGTVKFGEHTQAWFEAILKDRKVDLPGGLMSGHEKVEKPVTGWLDAKGAWLWAEGIAPARPPRIRPCC